jgi:hypothetical protein
MIRAWLISVSILLVAAGIWICAFLVAKSMAVVNGLLWFTPIVARFFMGRNALKRKILNGILVAVPGVLIFVVVMTGRFITCHSMGEVSGN